MKPLLDEIYGSRQGQVMEMSAFVGSRSAMRRSCCCKRSVIETVNDDLKNICQAEHTRHRSLNGFLLNLMRAIAAYSSFPKKPSIRKNIEGTTPKLIAVFNQQQQLLIAA